MYLLSLAVTFSQKPYQVTAAKLHWMKKIRHDKSLEAYQAAYAKYQKDRTELLDWVAEQDREKDKATMQTISKLPTEHWPSTIKHKGQRLHFQKNQSSLTSTSQADNKRMASYYSSVRARLRLRMQPFAFFKILYIYTIMFQIMLEELCNVLTSAAVRYCVFAAANGFIQINTYTHGFQTIKDLLQP